MFPMNIDQLHINFISIPYPVLEVNALIDVFTHNKHLLIYFSIEYRSITDQFVIHSISSTRDKMS